MKHKVGDVVLIKSLDWYNENKKSNGIVETSTCFLEEMSEYCGKISVITNIIGKAYEMNIDEGYYTWTDDMFEDIVCEPDKVSDNPKPIEENSKKIDWEQRRYELAKAAIPTAWSVCVKYDYSTSKYSHIGDEDIANESLCIADAIIKQLKSETL